MNSIADTDVVRGHKFLPSDSVLAQIPALYATDGVVLPEKIVHLHYFGPAGFDWLVMELDPLEMLAFGWACLNDQQNAELGYFSLEELGTLLVPVRVNLTQVETANGGEAVQQLSYKLPIERELSWLPQPFGSTQFGGNK